MTTTYLDAEFTQSQLTRSRANDFVRFIACLHATRSEGPFATTDAFAVRRAAQDFLLRWPRSVNADIVAKALDLNLKAATNPGTTLEPAFAAPLSAVKPLSDGFIALSRPASVLGKLLALGARRVPFATSVAVQTSGASYSWTGQNAPKPVSDMRYASATLDVAKASGTVVVSAELLKVASSASVELLQRDLGAGLNEFLDQQFTDPTNVGVLNVSPASITAAAPSFGSAGASGAVADFNKLIAQFVAVNPDARALAVITSPAMAVALGAAGASDTLGADGGMFRGTRVITGSVGARLIAVDPTHVIVADDGDLTVSTSTQGTVEMQTSATSPPDAGTIRVSLWQNDLVGIRPERFLNWRAARPSSVLYTNVAWV
jgi:hypothetical protein